MEGPCSAGGAAPTTHPDTTKSGNAAAICSHRPLSLLLLLVLCLLLHEQGGNAALCLAAVGVARAAGVVGAFCGGGFLEMAPQRRCWRRARGLLRGGAWW